MQSAGGLERRSRSDVVSHAVGLLFLSEAEAAPGLGVVQYDSLCRPARAQDLILAARVPDYRAGDLDVAISIGT